MNSSRINCHKQSFTKEENYTIIPHQRQTYRTNNETNNCLTKYKVVYTHMSM